MAERLTVARTEIVEANERDPHAAEKAGMSAALLDPLLLGQQRIDATIASCACLPRPRCPRTDIRWGTSGRWTRATRRR